MPATPTDPARSLAAQAFISRWQGVSASELATAQSFVIDLCELLGVPRPHATPEQDYMFERPITFSHGDGSTSPGRVDCYRRGAFCLESKKLKAASHTKGFDDGLLRARSQAESYARALPAAEGRPPFVLVVDVGNIIEVYAEFSQSGATYTPFPDPRSHRIRLADLAQPSTQARLRAIWQDPHSLDPSRISAKVTRQVADLLARLAKSMETTTGLASNQPLAPTHQALNTTENVASFLTRCLFSMFAEDVGLLPEGAFVGLLRTHRQDPATLRLMLQSLWTDMDRGGFSIALAKKVLHFNGKLFKNSAADGYSLLLNQAQIDLLIEAAQANWRDVEPAIFGTLLERALNPAERHALGAHYTPRAYVERLVLPTVIEPLRAEWANAQAAALVLAHEAADLEANPPVAKGGTDAASFDRQQLKSDQEALKRHEAEVRGKWRAARQQVMAFHHRLCTVRVLDPACGSANFLYVTLEHLKRLEGEVLNQLAALGDSQDTGILESETVNLQQLRGIELNDRAAALAELVLWIGYLQWHIRTQGNAAVAEPVVHDYRNIECRDAVLAWDAQAPALNAQGQLLTRWDGTTFKTHPVTGALVPDEAAQVPQWQYQNPRQAQWPQADFIVGNPPFIGAASMRAALGDGYAEALRSVWKDVPESADFVMYWWAHAAALVAGGFVRRMGLITTNSLRQTFNRRVVQAALDGAASGLSDGAGAVNASVSGGAGAGTAGGLILSKAQKSAPGDTHPSAARALGSPALNTKQPVALVFAIPDHPWVDSANGAAVRIAMTVVARALPDENTGAELAASADTGRLLSVTAEETGEHGEVAVTLVEKREQIHADLTVGANVTLAVALKSNAGISSPGIKLHGAGFIVSPTEVDSLLLHTNVINERDRQAIIRDYRNGRDLTDTPRGVKVIDAFGLSAEQLRNQFPAVYQWLLERVKPERDQNNRATYRNNWWIHGESRQEMRKQLATLPRYIATVETAKHRAFQFLDASVLPDNRLIAIALDDAFHLGVLSSCTHEAWALATGGTLEDRPVYTKSICFETFPFPSDDTGLTPDLTHHIRTLAEHIDRHRKQVLGLLPSNPGEPAVCDKLGRGLPGADFRAFDRLRPPAVPAPAHPQSIKPTTHPKSTALTHTTNPSSTALTHTADPSSTALTQTTRPNGITPSPETHPDNLPSTHTARPGATKDKPLTLTQLYNVLDALRTGRALTAAEKSIHQRGLVSVLQSLHDELDAAMLQAYGWSDLGAVPWRDEAERAAWTDTLLTRLVALNARRAAEEAAGTVRWLRPAFQNPQSKSEQVAQVQQGLEIDFPYKTAATASADTPQPWPATLPEQIKALAQLLAASPQALGLVQIEARFTGRGPWKKSLPTLLQALEALGRVQQTQADGDALWRA